MSHCGVFYVPGVSLRCSLDKGTDRSVTECPETDVFTKNKFLEVKSSRRSVFIFPSENRNVGKGWNKPADLRVHAGWAVPDECSRKET